MKSFRLIDLLFSFPIEQFTNDEIKFLIKSIFRFGNKFGYVSAQDIVVKFDAEDGDNGYNFFSDIKVVDKQYHHAKFQVIYTPKTNLNESIKKEVTVDEDYEMRTKEKPDSSLPIIVDRSDGLHVLESFTVHLTRNFAH